METWGPVKTIVTQDGAWELRPYRTTAEADEIVCVAYFLPGRGGGHCFAAGWVVETSLLTEGSTTVLYGVTHPDVARVTVPRDDAVMTILPEPLPELGVGYFQRVLEYGPPAGGFGNRIAGLAADGTKLGNEHNNVGRGGRDDFGPWDGTIDGWSRRYGHRSDRGGEP